MVKLVNGDQPVVKRLNAQRLNRKAKRRVRAHQHLVSTAQKLAHRLNLGLRHARLVNARRVAQVPLRCHLPVPLKALQAQRLVGKAAANRTLGHHHNGLLQTLLVQLVERNKHQRPRLARRRRRLDQQVLLTAHGVSALLHGAHAQRVGPA